MNRPRGLRDVAMLRSRHRCPPLRTPADVEAAGEQPTRTCCPRIAAIPVARITGTLGRCCDFDRCFRVLRSHLRPRLDEARRRWRDRPFPPIRVVRIGDDYYLVDGHHRVALAHERGMDTIEAYVG